MHNIISGNAAFATILDLFPEQVLWGTPCCQDGLNDLKSLIINDNWDKNPP